MALFKINRGNSTTLPSDMTDGWAYFCTDTGEFFIDYADANGVLCRKQINADEAKKLSGMTVEQILSSSQADWSVNDETSPAYVKNRTHYVKDPVYKVIAEYSNDAPKWFTASNVDEVSYHATGPIESMAAFTEGLLYIVTLNGVQYELTSVQVSTRFVVLGNPYLVNQNNIDTGENFCISQPATGLYGVYFYNTNLPETVSFTIEAPVVDIVQLDEKFISYKPGRVVEKGEVYTVTQADGTNVEQTAIGTGEVFNYKNNIATGSGSHAEGKLTIATGANSHAEGQETFAVGESSHSEGFLTYAGSKNQHVQGSFNIIDTDSKYAHIVGNGKYSGSWTNGRSNAHTIDWEGNAWFQGAVKVGGTGQDDEMAKELATQEYVDDALALKADNLNEHDAVELATKTGLVSPTTADDGAIYTDENGVIYSL